MLPHMLDLCKYKAAATLDCTGWTHMGSMMGEMGAAASTRSWRPSLLADVTAALSEAAAALAAADRRPPA